VFVGGSIVDRGGHNVLEPAAHGVAVVTGAHTHNFHAIVDLLNEAKAILQLPPLDDGEAVVALAEALRRLLANDEWRRELGDRAKQLVAANQGAVDKTMKLIAPLFSQTQSNNSRSDSLLHANAT
jgi:3-deoxy-D-manno-octulosonic-acid transferase